jgi:hypothetical protein
VRPLQAALLIGPTPIQLLVQNVNGDLDAAWCWAADRLAAVGVEHLLGFDFRHPTFDAGVYLVLARMDPDSDQAAELSWLAYEHHYDLSDAPEGYELEYTALYHLCQEYVGFTLEHVTPHSLASVLQNPAWQLTGLGRTGPFIDELVFPEADLIGASSTTWGLSDVRYRGAARSSPHQQWDRFVSQIPTGGRRKGPFPDRECCAEDPLSGDPITRPEGNRATALDHPMEARPQRAGGRIRRPHPDFC